MTTKRTPQQKSAAAKATSISLARPAPVTTSKTPQTKGMDGIRLHALFQQFNEQYWGSKLQTYSIHVVPRVLGAGAIGQCIRKLQLMEIRRGLSDPQSISTLLHEMAHAKTSGLHGMPWRKEMIRLRLAGAPLASSYLRIRLDDLDLGALPKRWRAFRGATQDLLGDLPEATLSQAIRYYFQNYGGPQTISAFLRKYPWARTVFNYEKRQEAEEEKQKAAFFATNR